MKRVLSLLLCASTLCALSCPPALAAGQTPTDPNAPSLGVFLQREYLFDPTVQYTSLSGGANHIAALREDGSLWTWGSNKYGQLGFGTDRAAYNAPISVLDDVKWARAGDNSTLAIKNDGSLWGFGKLNVYGGTPSPVRLADHAKAAAEGGGFFAVVTASGALEVYEDGVDGAPVTYAAGGVTDAAVCPGTSVYGKPTVTGTIQESIDNLEHAGDNEVPYIVYAISDGGVLTRYFLADGELHTETVAQNVTALQSDVSANDSMLYYLTADGTLYSCEGSNPNVLAPAAVASDVRLFAVNRLQCYALKTDGTLWYTNRNVPIAQGVTAFAAVGLNGIFALKTDHTIAAVNSNAGSGLEITFGRMNALPAGFLPVDREEPYYSKAMEIVGSATDDYEKARLICTWMNKNLKYDESRQNHNPLKLLETGIGVCEAYSGLTVQLFQAVGIPCGTIVHHLGEGHAWNYALIDGVIVFIDNTNISFDYSLTIEAGDAPASSSASGIGYSDWAAETVRAASSAGLLRFTSGRDLTAPITREQFAELAVQMVAAVSGKEPTGGGAFADCDNPAVQKAAALGIVTGVGDNKFAPEQTTNREQIAVMVSRTIDCLNGLNGKTVAPNAGDIEKFTDKGQVSAWAVDGVGVLAANGIMAGTSATTLSPKESCTVEQSILLLYRVYQLFMA